MYISDINDLLNISHSNIEGGLYGINYSHETSSSSESLVSWDSSNIDINPLFNNINNNDYRLSDYSMSIGVGDISTSFFLYDTQQPIVSIDVLNEVWITSGVIKLSGNASDVGSYPLISTGYGSTKGTGVRTVEIRIDAVNKFGSATFPAVLDWTSLNLDKDPLNFKHDQLYNFGFDQRLHGFEGRIRITARAIDAAGNIGLSIRDVGLDVAALDQPSKLVAQSSERLGSLFDFRRHDTKVRPIPPPTEIYYLRQNLILKLQMAQMALFEGNGVVYQRSLVEARDWISNSFDEDTKKVLTKDGWFKTGDIGIMREDGFFKIVDRKKDMIIVSGFNVYPSDIEEVAMKHEKVFEAGCIGVKGDDDQEVVKLFVSLNEGETLTKEEMTKYCRENLTAYKVPKLLEIVDEIPKSNVGKILRRELREK